MRIALFSLVLVGCSSSTATSEDTYPDRAAMESVVVGSWTGTYDVAHDAKVLLKVRSVPVVQPKCGSHVVSFKCVTTTDMGLESDATFGKESVALTGYVTTLGSTAENSTLSLKSTANDTLTCSHRNDRWVECKLHLHGVDYGPFELTTSG